MSTEFTEENTMQKLNVESLESLNIFELNPLNVRDWSKYSVTAVIKEGKLVFIADHKDAPSGLQELIDSMIEYQNSEETVNAVAVVNLYEPFQVSPKTQNGKYILLSGNSRVFLIRNFIEAYSNDLSAEDQAVYSLRVNPLRYELKKNYSSTDLLTYQLTGNSTIPLSGLQKSRLIYKRVSELREGEPDLYAGKSKENSGRLKEQIRSEFNVSNETYNKALQIAEQLDPFFVALLESGAIQNQDVALSLQKILKHKDYGSAVGNAEILWNMVVQVARDDGKFFPTGVHVTKVRNEIAKEFGEIEEIEESEDSDPSIGEDEQPAKNETKLQEIERLRGLERSELNDEAVTNINALVETLVEVDPTQFDTDDAIKIALMMSEFSSKVSKLKTTAQKELAAAEKAATKEAEAVAKAAAKEAEAVAV